MERKALFLDMDGTTLNDEIQIPKENYEAMEAAVKAGHRCCLPWHEQTDHTVRRPTAGNA